MSSLKFFAVLTCSVVLSSCAAAPAPSPQATTAEPYSSTKDTEPLLNLDDFVLIKGGSFIMGDIYGSDQYAKPAHKVTVADFYLSQYEVTFEEYDRFCNDTGRPHPDDNGWGRGDRPVINVTHADAVAYADWLSRKTGKSFRLPSEAEWEYAARGGKSTNFWWGNRIGSGNANCRGCGSARDGKKTAPVGSFKPSPYGLYDMHGNVYEWVADSWHKNYEGAPVDGSSREIDGEDQHVSRGGSFLEIPISLHVYSRNWSDGKEPRKDIGFRLAMDP